ncbi:hypothetical protein AX15_005017 [Amanita polypyramis BW_CC]|nr:hypothetical protein AX15_005017 [Amanita polypyramis BW_CC]
MMDLRALPAIARLSNNVIRVLGQNPGKFTLQGTNTYIVGRENPYILIDVGEGCDQYIPLLESAFRDLAQPTNPTQPDVSDVIISHWHHDHIGGLPSVLPLLRKRWEERKTGLPYRPPRLHKFPLPRDNPPLVDSSSTPPSITPLLSQDLFIPARDGSLFHDLHDGQHFPMLSAPPLHVLHTPGHTTDSISIYIPSDKALYTSDSVLGQGTATFEDLSTYLSSLKKMLEYIQTEGPDNAVSLYPGHGATVTDGVMVLNTYIQHRLEREAQIINILQNVPPAEGDSSLESWTTWMIVKNIYASYPKTLWLPAAGSVNLHLRKLEVDGSVKRLGGGGKDTSWEFIKHP